MNRDIQCSVEVLTHNCAATLPKTLKSINRFADVIVCDGGSIDDTVAIARAAGCRVFAQEVRFRNPDNTIRDFSGVRNQGLAAAKYPWFLFVDSDEVLAEELVEEIGIIVKAGMPPAAYWIPRLYVHGGRIVRCASSYPSRQMRLFHKDAVHSFEKEIHERIIVREGAAVHTARGAMLIPVLENRRERLKKMDYYIVLERQRGERITGRDVLRTVFTAGKVIILYNVRLLKNAFCCRGHKLPLLMEWDAQLYQIKNAISAISALGKSYLYEFHRRS